MGVPHYAGGLAEVVCNPRFSTAVGLLLTGLEQRQREEHVRLHTGSFKSVFERMASWFKGNF
jgi:cell division protein FtsA